MPAGPAAACAGALPLSSSAIVSAIVNTLNSATAAAGSCVSAVAPAADVTALLPAVPGRLSLVPLLNFMGVSMVDALRERGRSDDFDVDELFEATDVLRALFGVDALTSFFKSSSLDVSFIMTSGSVVESLAPSAGLGLFSATGLFLPVFCTDRMVDFEIPPATGVVPLVILLAAPSSTDSTLVCKLLTLDGVLTPFSVIGDVMSARTSSSPATNDVSEFSVASDVLDGFFFFAALARDFVRVFFTLSLIVDVVYVVSLTTRTQSQVLYASTLRAQAISAGCKSLQNLSKILHLSANSFFQW